MTKAGPTVPKRGAGRPPRSSGAGDGSGVREALLKTALELFSTADYDAVGTREIALRAGAAVTALYYHFGDKQGLYVAALKVEMARYGEAMLDAIRSSDDPELALFRLMDRLSHVLRGPRYRMVVRLQGGAAREPMTAVMRELFPEQLELAAAAVKRITGDADPLPKTVALYFLMQGLNSTRALLNDLPWLSGPSERSAREAIYVLSMILPQVDWEAVSRKPA